MLLLPLKSLFVGVVLLQGCALFGPNSNLSADQLKAIAGDNKNSIFCNVTNGSGLTVKTVVVTSDQTRNVDADVNTEGNCDKIQSRTVTPQKPVAAQVNNVPIPVVVVPSPVK